jgi:hypothetical protein
MGGRNYGEWVMAKERAEQLHEREVHTLYISGVI